MARKFFQQVALCAAPKWVIMLLSAVAAASTATAGPLNIHERRNTKVNLKLLRSPLLPISHCISIFISKISNFAIEFYWLTRTEKTMKDGGNRKINFPCGKCSREFWCFEWNEKQTRIACVTKSDFWEQSRACDHKRSWLDWLNCCDTVRQDDDEKTYIYIFKCLILVPLFAIRIFLPQLTSRHFLGRFTGRRNATHM